MTMNTKDIVFFSGWYVLLLLFFLLGDSFAGWYLMGLLAAWLGCGRFFFYRDEFSRAKETIQGAVWWTVILFGSAIVSWWTHSIPLTLNWWMFVATGILSALFFGQLTVKKERIIPIAGGLVLLVSVMIALNAFFFLFPLYASLLPGTNLLYATYGHNHLAALLLFSIPISWWLVAASNRRFMIVIPIIHTLALLFSLGRVALLVGLLQTGFLWWFYFRHLKKPLINLGVGTVLLVLFLVFSTLISISLLPTRFLETHCPLPQYKKQFCKPFAKEDRLQYWMQSWLALRDFPLVGYGPGTIQLITQRYRQSPYLNTAFTHNAYFQFLAELGLPVGLGWIAWLLWLLQKAYKAAFSSTTKKLTLFQVFFVAIAGQFLNSFFDFDWNFIGVWLVTLTLLGVLTARSKFPPLFSARMTQLLSQFRLELLITLFLLVGSAGFLLAQRALDQGRIELIVNIFPYFSWQSRTLLVNQDKLTSALKNHLRRVYYFHPSYYQFTQSEQLNTNEQIAFYQGLKQIDPWSYWSGKPVLLSLYRKQGDVVRFIATESELEQMGEGDGMRAKQFMSLSNKEIISNELIEMARQLVERGDAATAAELLGKAEEMRPWSLLTLPPLVLFDSPPAQIQDFVRGLAQRVSNERLGEAGKQYGELLFAVLQQNLSHGHFDQLGADLEAIVTLNPWMKSIVWGEVSKKAYTNILQEKDEEQQEHLVSLLLNVKSALKINREEDQYFWLNRWANWLLTARTQAIVAGDAQHEQMWAQKYREWGNHNESTELEVLSQLQRRFPSFIQARAIAQLELLLNYQAEVLPDPFWALSQKGHFYMYQLAQVDSPSASHDENHDKQYWYEKAHNAFEECIKTYRQIAGKDNDECVSALSDLEKGWVTGDRIFEVQQIIEGKRSWESFL